MLLGIFLLLVIAAAVVIVAKWYRKKRRDIPFEMEDAVNLSTMSQPSNSLQVNLRSNVEMKKMSGYEEFEDEESNNNENDNNNLSENATTNEKSE